MNKIKVAHIADVHLRTQQYGYKRRGQDFFDGLKSAVEACHAAGANAILCSGDLFDTTTPSSAVVIDQLGEVERMLEEYKLQMIVSPGNHDNNSPHWASVYNARGHIVVPQAGHRIKVGCPGGEVSVVALPWMNPDELRTELESTPSADILMWHGEIKEFTGYPKQDAIEVADFPAGKWTIVAMGDQHVHKMIRRKDGLVVAYPGSTESCSKSEDHDKKAYMYTFEGDTRKMVLTDIEDIPFKTRPKQHFILHSEEDVDRACQELMSDALVYCDYAMGLKNVRNRLIAAAVTRGIEPPTISMTSFTTLKTTRDITLERETAIASPGQYVHEHAKQYFEEAYREKLAAFCVNLLTPSLDPKDTIARFCKEELS